MTNPAPINGNTGLSLNADDDGGFFRQKVRDYYAAGPLPLSGGAPPPPATATPTSPPVATATPTSPPAATATPTSTTQGFTTSASASPSSVARGATTAITVAVTSGAASNVLVDLELYDPSGAKVAQQVWDAQAFSAGQRRSFTLNWSAPSGAALGSYTDPSRRFPSRVGRPAATGNGSAGSLSVTAASAPTATPTPTAVPTQVTQPGFTSSATVAPASVARGAPVTIAAAVRSQTAAAALIDVEVYTAGVKVAQQVWDSQGFAAGQQRTFSFAWTPPGNAANGSYTVKIGVFGPGWSPLHHWNNSASTFSVT